VSTNEFSWETEIYAKGLQLNRWPFTDLVADVMRHTTGRDRSEMSVLEIGCGAGNNIWFLVDSGFSVAGMDISPTAIAITRRRIAELGFDQPDLRVGSVVELPWEASTFDLVIDRGTFSPLLVDEAAATVREVSRVLKPGGAFFSYYLFGWNCSGRKLGEEFAPRSFRGFSGGQFAKNPMITFFDAELIHELWRPLVITELRRFEVTREGTDVVEEYFDVRAVKDAGGSGGL